MGVAVALSVLCACGALWSPALDASDLANEFKLTPKARAGLVCVAARPPMRWWRC